MVDFELNRHEMLVCDIFGSIRRKTIDVKTTRNQNGALWVTEYHKKSPCDIYIQVVINNNIGSIKGWIDKSKLFTMSEYVSGNHPSYKLTQDLLQPIQTLVKNNNGI